MLVESEATIVDAQVLGFRATCEMLQSVGPCSRWGLLCGLHGLA